MGHLGAMLGHLGAMLSHRGVMLGDLGAMLGLCWAILGLCWAILEPSWAYVGPSWGHVGPKLGHLGVHLGPSWGYVGARGVPPQVFFSRFMLFFSKCQKHRKLRGFVGDYASSAAGAGSRIAKATAFGRGLCPSTGPAGPIVLAHQNGYAIRVTQQVATSNRS